MAKFSVAFSFSFFLPCTRFLKVDAYKLRGEGKGSVVAVCGDFGSSLTAFALCILPVSYTHLTLPTTERV